MAFDDGTLRPISLTAGLSGFDDGTLTAAPAKEKSSIARRVIGDSLVSLAKGVVSVPEAAVGLADIPTFGAAGKLAEKAGFRPAEAKEIIGELYSDDQNAANQRVANAEGFVGTGKAMLENPSTIAQTAAESVPLIFGGGAVARGLTAIPRAGISPLAAGAAGEGAVGAGMAAESVRQQTEDGYLTPKQAGLSLATGLATGLIGVGGAKVAQKLGVGEVDTLLAGGSRPDGKGVVRSAAEGAVVEGALQELPQSAQEQVLQNLALDRPAGEGVAESAAAGLLAGGLVGGIAGPLGREKVQPEASDENPAPQPVDRPDPANGVLSRAASRLPAPSPVLALPAPEPVVFVDSDGQAQDIGPVRNVDGVMRPEPQAYRPQSAPAVMSGGGGVDRQAPLGERPNTVPAEEQRRIDRLKVADIEQERADRLAAAYVDQANRAVAEVMQQRLADNIEEPKHALPKGLDLADKQNHGRWLVDTYRGSVEALIGQLEKGGGVAYVRDANDRITGRTPSSNPKWWQDMDPGVKPGSVEQARAVVNKALEGKNLGPKQARFIAAMMDLVDDIRLPPEQAAANQAILLELEWAASGEAARNQEEMNQGGRQYDIDPQDDEELYAYLDGKVEPFRMADLSPEELEQVRAELILLDDTSEATAAAGNNDEPEVVFNGIDQRAVKAGSEVLAQQGLQGDQRGDSEAEGILTTYTEAELAERAEVERAARQAEDKAAVDAETKIKAESEVAGFGLTGSDRPADIGAAAGQADLLQTPVTTSDRTDPEAPITSSAEPAPSIAGKDIDGDWVEFSKASETLGIPRADMPQIKAEHRGAMVNFLKARGIRHTESTVPASTLKPTQAEFSRKKVEAAKAFEGGDRAILVSRDGHVLDGHHQWLARRDAGEDVRIIRLSRNIKNLLEAVREFPSAGVDGKAQPAAEPAPKPKPQQKAKAEPATKPQIDDFGEKLGGARKDELRNVRDRLESMDDQAIAGSTLSQLWPKGEVDKIDDPFHAAAYWALRSEIPAKPRVGYKLQRWVERVKGARDTLTYLASLGSDTSLSKLRAASPVLRPFADRVELLQAIDRDHWPRIGRLERQSGKYNDNGTMVPGSWFVVEIDKKRKSFYGHDSMSSALPAIKGSLDQRSAPQQKMKFAIYSNRRGSVVFIAKDGDKEKRPLKEFSDLKSARAYLEENHDLLVESWEAVKNRDNVTKSDMRRDTNEQRVGTDYRDGKDVTPEQFLDAFGFRGIEFGNWVSQGKGGRERQGMLNEAYDAFMDLASVVGVPAKALSLEGNLGVGFGSRGKGKASAHFEPGNVVINLTKTRGAGSLAHEWFHALDNYFARKRGGEQPLERGMKAQEAYRKNNFITYRPERLFVHKSVRSTPITRAALESYHKRNPSAGFYNPENWVPDPNHREGVRPEVERAFAELVATLDQSPMAQRAASIDKAPDGYWSRIIERGARAFETHVIAKLADQGRRNDYLANVTSLEEFARDPGRYPYLTSDEQGPVTEAFDKLFSTVETREKDGKVEMYSKQAKPKAKGIDLASAQQVATNLGKMRVPVEAVQNESGLPASVQRGIKRRGWEGRVEGVFYQGKAYLIADNLPSPERAYAVALHEVVGHAGIKGVLGDRLNPIMRQIYRSMSTAERSRIERGYGRQLQEMTQAVAEQTVAEEYVARLSETNPESTVVQRVVTAIRNFLRQMFGSAVKWSRADIVGLLAKSKRYIGQQSALMGDTAYSLADTSQTDTPKFKRWFGDSKVVDENGDPLVMYHGTDRDFSEFDKSTVRSRFSYSLGFHFSSAPWDANAYAIEGYERQKEDLLDGGNIMPVYLKAENPLVIRTDQPGASMEADLNRGVIIEQLLASRKTDSPYDSVMIVKKNKAEDSEWDHINVIVFDPGQIKSAIGNNGNFDSTDSDIRFSLAEDAATDEALRKLGLKESARETLAERIRAMTTADFRSMTSAWSKRSEEGLFDGLNGIKKAEEAVGITDPNQQGYVSARLATGIADVMHAVMHYGAPEWQDGIIGARPDTTGLLDILGKLGGENITDWLGWLGGKRAQMLKSQGRENNLTDEEIAELLALGNGKEKLFNEVYQEYTKINEAVLDVAQEAGLVTADARQSWATEYYVPFYRTDEEGLFTAPRGKKGLSHQTAGIKALKGGKLPTNDLLENILTNWTRRIDASMKNKALLEVVDNLKGSDFLSDESIRYTQAMIPRVELAKRVRKDRKTLAAVSDMLGMPEGSAAIKVAGELMKPENQGFEKLWAATAPTDPDIIRVQRDGGNEYYRVNDESLLRGLKHIAGTTFNDPITKIGRAFKRLLTTGVTASPDFILRNFIRDAAHAWVINKDGYKLGIDSIKGLKNAFSQDKDYRDLMFAGSSFQGGYVHGNDPEAAAQIIRRALDKKGISKAQRDSYMDSLVTTPAQMAGLLKKGWEKYREAGDKVENSQRLATYKAALAAGKSKRQAAYEAKDLMDYSLRGNFAAAQWFTDVVPFLNARMQGLYKLGRAMKGDNAAIAKEVAMKGAYMAAFSLLLAAINGDDDRYKELPEWDKDMHWHIWIGDEHFRIPKPFELGLIFGTVPERMLGAMTGTQSGEQLTSAVARGVFETLAFNPVPQFYQPIREIQANRDFFRDRPIEGMADEGKLPEARYDDRTSAIGKALGKVTGPALGVSPKQLDHLVQGYTGTLGGYVLAMSSLIADMGTPGEAPSRGLARAPLAKVIYSGTDPRSTQYHTQFYDMVSEADQIYRTLRSYREEGRAEAASELMADQGDKLKHRRALGMARQQFGAIRKRMTDIYRDESMSGNDKRLALNELQLRSNQIAERMVRMAGADF